MQFNLRTLFLSVTLLAMLLAAVVGLRELKHRQAVYHAFLGHTYFQDQQGENLEPYGSWMPLAPSSVYGFETRMYGRRDASIDRLSEFPNLGRIWIAFGLSKGTLDPRFADTLKKLPRLKSLVILECNSLPEVLPSLKGNQALEILDLGMNSDPLAWRSRGPFRPVSDESLAALATLTGLRELDLGCWPIDDRLLETIAKLPNLELLHLDDAQIQDRHLPIIARCGKLKQLDLAHNEISDRGIEALAACTTLERLSLVRNPISDHSLRILARLPALKVLHVDSVPLTDAGLIHFAGNPTLEELSLRLTAITDEGLQAVARLPKLRSLAIGRNAIKDRGIEALVACQWLETLSLTETQISDLALQSIAKLANLKSLDISNTRISDRGIAHLAGSSLVELNFDATDTTMACAPSLQTMRSLQRVHVYQNRSTGLIHQELREGFSPIDSQAANPFVRLSPSRRAELE